MSVSGRLCGNATNAGKERNGPHGGGRRRQGGADKGHADRYPQASKAPALRSLEELREEWLRRKAQAGNSDHIPEADELREDSRGAGGGCSSKRSAEKSGRGRRAAGGIGDASKAAQQPHDTATSGVVQPDKAHVEKRNQDTHHRQEHKRKEQHQEQLQEQQHQQQQQLQQQRPVQQHHPVHGDAGGQCSSASHVDDDKEVVFDRHHKACGWSRAVEKEGAVKQQQQQQQPLAAEAGKVEVMQPEDVTVTLPAQPVGGEASSRFDIQALLAMRPRWQPRTAVCELPMTLELPREVVHASRALLRNTNGNLKVGKPGEGAITAGDDEEPQTAGDEEDSSGAKADKPLDALESKLMQAIKADVEPFFFTDEDEDDDENLPVAESRGFSKWFGTRVRSTSGSGGAGATSGETGVSTDAGSGDESSEEVEEACLPMVREPVRR